MTAIDYLFDFTDPNNREQVLLVLPAGDGKVIDSLGFIVGDNSTKKGVILNRDAVRELYEVIGQFLDGGA